MCTYTIKLIYFSFCSIVANNFSFSIKFYRTHHAKNRHLPTVYNVPYPTNFFTQCARKLIKTTENP